LWTEILCRDFILIWRPRIAISYFGKELTTLHDAYMHARKLIDKILLRVGHDDAEAWKVVILNDVHDAQMIVPFSVSPALSAQRRATLRESSKT
jgi:hypothetical protein